MKYLKDDFKGMVPYYSPNLTEGIIINSNESPYLPPKSVLAEFDKLNFNSYNRYPDMANLALCEAIAKRYNVNTDNVTVGVGSDELLDSCFRAVLNPGDVVLGFSPSFSMYKIFAELVGATYIGVDNPDYKINVDDIIEAIKKNNPKMVLLCTPNNPTGEYIPEEDVRRVVESTDALVVLDLAYIDFSYKDYFYLGLEYDNVIAFKTFSKALALPSLRVGYAIAKKDNIDMLKCVKPPYSVTSISEAYATIAMNHFDDYKPQIELTKQERTRMFNELSSLGFSVYPSEANFIFVTMDKKYYDILLENKIYIRRFKDGIYRITIGTKEENDRVLEVIKNAN